MAQQSTAGEITAFLDQLARQAEITDFIQNLGRDLVASGVLRAEEFACQPHTNSWLLYRGGLEQTEFLRSNRDKQRSDYASPRVSSPRRYPRFEPERLHPKSVETVVKPDGTVKNRETTDYGAWRVKARRLWRQWRLRVMMRKAEDRQRCPGVRRFATKGQPGPDSFIVAWCRSPFGCDVVRR